MVKCSKCKERLAVCQWGTFIQHEDEIEYICASCSFKDEHNNLKIVEARLKEARSIIRDIANKD